MVMLSREGANEVAACFLARYYAELVQRGNMPLNLTDLYDDESHVLLANIEESTPVVVQGKANVALHLSKLDSILSKRKVEVISADSVPLPDGGVEIVCQGILFLTGSRRVFIQVFVLVPTAYRPDTYHIASDYLRFVNAEAELIPENATVVTQEQMAAHLAQQLAQAQAQALAQQAQQQAAAAREHVAIPAPASQQRQHKPAEAAHPQRRSAEPQAHGHPQRRSAEPQQQHTRAEGERPAPRERPVREHKEERPVRERPPRQEREKPEGRRERLPRYGEEKKEAAAKAADAKPAASASPKERPERAPRGNNNSHSNNASANTTEFVRFCNVPVDVKLSDIKEQLKKEDAETKDAFWCGQDRKHAVVEVVPDVSRRLLKKGIFVVLTHEVKAVKYTP